VSLGVDIVASSSVEPNMSREILEYLWDVERKEEIGGYEPDKVLLRLCCEEELVSRVVARGCKRKERKWTRRLQALLLYTLLGEAYSPLVQIPRLNTVKQKPRVPSLVLSGDFEDRRSILKHVISADEQRISILEDSNTVSVPWELQKGEG
jgi:hypothetical protein